MNFIQLDCENEEQTENENLFLKKFEKNLVKRWNLVEKENWFKKD